MQMHSDDDDYLPLFEEPISWMRIRADPSADHNCEHIPNRTHRLHTTSPRNDPEGYVARATITASAMRTRASNVVDSLRDLILAPTTSTMDDEGDNEDHPIVKCPVCSEVFLDYEESDHPNTPRKRALMSSARCSHGALSLFTRLESCPVCFGDNIEPPNVVALACGHVVCRDDFCRLGGHVGDKRPEKFPKPLPMPKRRKVSGWMDTEGNGFLSRE